MAKLKDTDIKLVIAGHCAPGCSCQLLLSFLEGLFISTAMAIPLPITILLRGARFCTIRGIINGILTFRGRAIIQAGIILLIFTPVIRVVFSAIGFILEKDYLYTGITLLVLLIIFISMLSGHSA
ncbi:DUF1634 domain-containing protein [Mucilaginibacter humi]|uniref:DUF1634 domain-containing protein n=1 Tax=Mucilaginibacter humi TaxID=2732510 RepID=UPI00293BE896|nr:DUF1634 domain-containing protein [Mucilaginibacter humi]